jgi:hypothetical protein
VDEINECVGYEKDARARDHKWYGKWMQSGWKWCKSKEWIVDKRMGTKRDDKSMKIRVEE